MTLQCCSIVHTEVVENYLKAVFTLSAIGRPTTSALAEHLNVSPPTVSAMLKRLEPAGLISRTAAHVTLTEHGQGHALGIVRRHRLVESFLVEVVGLGWDEVHAEAEVLEHVISKNLEVRIDDLLGYPTHDPHGDPIPPVAGQHVEILGIPLADVAAGSRFQVERVSDRSSAGLRRLGGLGIRPGVVLTVVEWPFGGPLWVDIDGRPEALGPGLVELIHGRTI